MGCLLGWIREGRAIPLEDLSADYVIQSFSVEEGLPQNSVTRIVQTPDGYLWFSTYRGLVRFDGVRFTVYDSGNTPAVAGDDVVQSLDYDHRGYLQVIMKDGNLLWVKNGQLTRGNGVRGIPDIPISRRMESPDGSLYLGTPDASRWFAETPSGDFIAGRFGAHSTVRSVETVTVDSNGILWDAEVPRRRRFARCSKTVRIIFGSALKERDSPVLARAYFAR